MTEYSTQFNGTTNMESSRTLQPPVKPGHSSKMLYATEIYHDDNDVDMQEPTFYPHYQNGTMSTFAETFSYSSENTGGQREERPEPPKHLNGHPEAPKAPISPFFDITPKTQTRKSPLHASSSAQMCSPSRFRSNPLSVNTSSSDSWEDSFGDPKHHDISREVSLLDMVDSRDDEESASENEEECRDGLDEEDTHNYSRVGSYSFHNDSYRDGTFSLPKLAQGPCSHLRDRSMKSKSRWMNQLSQNDGQPRSCMKDQFLYSEEQLQQQKCRSMHEQGPCSHLRKNKTSKWMERFYRKDSKLRNEPDEQERESRVTEQQFLHSAERLEKQKSSLNVNTDLFRQGSSFLSPLTTLFNSLSCSSQNVDDLKNDVE